MGLENQENKAFVAAKTLLCQDCGLTHYDVSKPLKLFYCISTSGLDASLIHLVPDMSKLLVVYASCTIATPEQNYA